MAPPESGAALWQPRKLHHAFATTYERLSSALRLHISYRWIPMSSSRIEVAAGPQTAMAVPQPDGGRSARYGIPLPAVGQRQDFAGEVQRNCGRDRA